MTVCLNRRVALRCVQRSNCNSSVTLHSQGMGCLEHRYFAKHVGGIMLEVMPTVYVRPEWLILCLCGVDIIHGTAEQNE